MGSRPRGSLATTWFSRIVPAPLAALLLTAVVCGPVWGQSNGNGILLRAYRCPSGESEAWASALRSQFAGRADVRIAADPRGEQIIIQASPEVHAQLAGQFTGMNNGRAAGMAGAAVNSGIPQNSLRASAAGVSDGSPLATSPPQQSQIAQATQATPFAAVPLPVQPTLGSPLLAPAGSPSPVAAVPSGNDTQPRAYSVTLTNVNARQLEATLSQVFGSRFAPVAASAGAAKSFVVMSPGIGNARIDFLPAGNQAVISGPAAGADGLARVVQALDTRPASAEERTELVPLGRVTPATARRAVEALSASGSAPQVRGQLMALQTQGGAQGGNGGNDATQDHQRPNDEQANGGPQENGAPPQDQEGGGQGAQGGGMIGPVQVELIDGLDVIILRGFRRDVDRVLGVIQQIERLSAVTEPAIEIYSLQHVDSVAMADLIVPLYDEFFGPRRGAVRITALVKPNALLLIGRKESVASAIDLVKKLDNPVPPDSQFHVFRLKHAPATTAQATLQEYFQTREGGLTSAVQVIADFRTNALLVQASPRDLQEVAALVDRIDTTTSAAVNELRVFRLQNSLATDLAPILQAAVTGAQAATPSTTTRTPGQGGQQQGQQAAASSAARPADKSAILRFLTIDSRGRRVLESGVLGDIHINADSRANAIVVSAPGENMELIGALILQLDQMPAAEAQIKVFTVKNGDATSLVDMLQQLFGTQTSVGQQGGGGVQLNAVSGESPIVALRFAIDTRTNSIIATGTPNALTVVEAILTRLNETDFRNRKSIVYRLRNAPALDVATAINQFLTSERQVEQINPGVTSPFEQLEREVIVVPETVSNSLIVSATPQFYDEIQRIIEDLDQRPPMVLVQVLIAQVDLNNTDEFGIELGLQDQVLFDRSVLDNIQTLTETTYDPNGNGNPVAQNQKIVTGTLTPGFNWNNQPLGNYNPGNANVVGSQGLTHFGVGRTNNELGYGGLVLAASSESVSILIRALKECRRLEVLARPQIQTLDNQAAFVQVGQRVPTISNVSFNNFGQINSVQYQNVGIILGVTPRISPDGVVVMEINAERSEVGPEEEGIPISISTTGQVVRQPRIDITTAQTTVSATDGQTIILGGLISSSKQEFHRKVPWLGDIPILGHLFRYDGFSGQRRELLMIMTPHIVRTQEESERLKRVESARMHWCLNDVLDMHGDEHLQGRNRDWSDAETTVVYPHLDPLGRAAREPSAEETPQLAPTPDNCPNGAPLEEIEGDPSAAPTTEPVIEDASPPEEVPSPTPAPMRRPPPEDAQSKVPGLKAALGVKSSGGSGDAAAGGPELAAPQEPKKGLLGAWKRPGKLTLRREVAAVDPQPPTAAAPPNAPPAAKATGSPTLAKRSPGQPSPRALAKTTTRAASKTPTKATPKPSETNAENAAVANALQQQPSVPAGVQQAGYQALPRVASATPPNNERMTAPSGPSPNAETNCLVYYASPPTANMAVIGTTGAVAPSTARLPSSAGAPPQALSFAPPPVAAGFAPMPLPSATYAMPAATQAAAPAMAPAALPATYALPAGSPLGQQASFAAPTTTVNATPSAATAAAYYAPAASYPAPGPYGQGPAPYVQNPSAAPSYR